MIKTILTLLFIAVLSGCASSSQMMQAQEVRKKAVDKYCDELDPLLRGAIRASFNAVPKTEKGNWSEHKIHCAKDALEN